MTTPTRTENLSGTENRLADLVVFERLEVGPLGQPRHSQPKHQLGLAREPPFG